MSKPEAKGAQNLEEILSSIRRSLSEESTAGLVDLRPAATPAERAWSSGARATETKAPAAKAAAPVPEAAPRNDGLSGRLAGALNGSPSAFDDDLGDFFAHVPKRAVPPAAGDAPKPAVNGSGGADPLWFLGRPGAPEDPAAPAATARARTDHSERQQPPAEEITLSRPETLRPSLPPLFGADQETNLAAKVAGLTEPQVPSIDDMLSAFSFDAPPARAAKVEAPPQPAAEVPAPAVPPAAAPEPLPEALPAALAEPAPAPNLEASPEPALSPVLDAPPEPIEVPVAPPEGVINPWGPTAVAANAAPDPEPERSPAAEAVVPGAVEAPAPANPALEHMIAQLLEPVLVRWLDANLPRMIETTVRAEVERAINARPGPKQGPTQG